MQDWGHLPWPILHHVLDQLSRLLAAEGPLPVRAALSAADTAAPNRHWAESAQTELRLEVWCSGSSRGQLHALLWLAGRARLAALHFRQPEDCPASAAAVFELLAHSGFTQRAGRYLLTLTGAPATQASGKHKLHPLPLAAYPGLEQLQVYVPPHQQVFSLRGGGGGGLQELTRLRQLDISGRHYLALRTLPPRLERLTVSAWHVLAEPEVLVRCSRVQVLAAAVLLSEHVLPYAGLAGVAAAAAAEARLAQLAALLAAAGLPEGHCILLHTNLVCFQHGGGGAEVKLVAPRGAGAAAGAAAEAAAAGAGGGLHAHPDWVAAAAAAEAAVAAAEAAAAAPAGAAAVHPAPGAAGAGGGGNQPHRGAAGAGGAAFSPLWAQWGGVSATLKPAPLGVAWPAALGPNAPSGSGPKMQVVLQHACGASADACGL